MKRHGMVVGLLQPETEERVPWWNPFDEDREEQMSIRIAAISPLVCEAM